jgi:hypothetical protein
MREDCGRQRVLRMADECFQFRKGNSASFEGNCSRLATQLPKIHGQGKAPLITKAIAPYQSFLEFANPIYSEISHENSRL